MRTTQEKFLEVMKALALELNLDLVVDKPWSNAGMISFETLTGFESLIRFRYEFQEGYAQFHEVSEHGVIVAPKDSFMFDKWAHVNCPDLGEFVNFLKGELVHALTKIEFTEEFSAHGNK